MIRDDLGPMDTAVLVCKDMRPARLALGAAPVVLLQLGRVDLQRWILLGLGPGDPHRRDFRLGVDHGRQHQFRRVLAAKERPPKEERIL